MSDVAATNSNGDPRLGSTELAAAALLVGAVWLVYWRSLDAPLVCDDTITVTENDSLRRLWPLVGDGEVRGPLSPAKDLPTSGRPLVNLTFALNYQLGGLTTRGYHIVNLLLHTLNVLLLATLMRRGLRLPYFNDRFAAAAGPIAFAIALLWAVHPLNTETVAYLTQRTELMVSLFYLTTLLASLRFLTERRPAWGWLAVLACWAGMASKEIMATAPVMVLLLDRTLIASSLREAWQRSRPLYVGLFSSWLLLVCLAGPGPRSASAGFQLGVPAIDWWFTQSKVLLMYLRLAVWPWPLSIHYEPPYLTSFADAWRYVVPVAALVVGALVLLWRRSPVGYLAAFALAILAPTLIVPIPTEIAAERRMYLPLAAILTLLIAGGYRLLQHVATTRIALATTVMIAMILAAAGGVVSFVRLGDYESEPLLWRQVIEHDPNNPTALYNVGTQYLERNEPQRAIEYFERAIAARPDHAQAHHNLGAALATLGRRDEATRQFERAVELEPRYAMGYVKIGIAALEAGDAAAAQKNFEAALRLQPDDAEARGGMARLLLQNGKPDEALDHARAAAAALPNDANIQNTLGAALARKQQFVEAIEHFEAAVQLDPNLLQARGNLMAAYASAGRSQEARATAEEVLERVRAVGDKPLEEKVNAFLQSFESQGGAPKNESNSRDGK